MSNLEVFTIAEQVANHLRQEIQRGLLQGLMPGRNELATQLGFNGKTIEAALKLLERGGVLQSQGPGRKRRIVEADKLASRHADCDPGLRTAERDRGLHDRDAPPFGRGGSPLFFYR